MNQRIFEHPDWPGVRVFADAPSQALRGEMQGALHSAQNGHGNLGHVIGRYINKQVGGWEGEDAGKPFTKRQKNNLRMVWELQVDVFVWLTNDCVHISEDEEGNSDDSSD